MNLILLERDEVNEGLVILQDHRARHIVKILAGQPGDTIRVGMINGRTGHGNIVNIKRKFPFVVELAVSLSSPPPPPPRIDLLLALPRPIMLKRILSQVTSLGIGKIFIINAGRVEKSFWDSGLLRPEEYRPHLIQGLEQAIDTTIPQLLIKRRFRPFVEDELAQMAKNYGHLLLAHPDTGSTLSSCLPKKSGRVLYGVGPEGGWLDFEVEQLAKAGMHPFSMGSRILKVDTAAIAIHSRITQILEDDQGHSHRQHPCLL